MSFILDFLLLFISGLFAVGQSDYLLPTDTDAFLSEPLKSEFRCVKTGYFADIDNNCQMYHVCVKQRKATGHEVVRQFSFVCGNGTIFNQLTMICDAPDESIPCEDAPKFYRLNSKVGHPNVPLHHGNDWEEGYNQDNPYSSNDYDDNYRSPSPDYFSEPYYPPERSYSPLSYSDPYYYNPRYSASNSRVSSDPSYSESSYFNRESSYRVASRPVSPNRATSSRDFSNRALSNSAPNFARTISHQNYHASNVPLARSYENLHYEESGSRYDQPRHRSSHINK